LAIRVNSNMCSFSRLVIVLMLIWIVVLVVHPAVDLPQTVLKTRQLFPLTLLICSAVLAIAGRDVLRPVCCVPHELAAHLFSTCCSPLERSCIQRC
jgi:hypothetical protein